MPYSCGLTVSRSGEADKTIPFGDSLAVTRKLSDTSDISYQVRDEDRYFSPDSNSEWAGVMDGKAYQADGHSYGKWMDVEGTTEDGTAFQLPRGIPDTHDYQLAQGECDTPFGWKLKGIAAKLYKNKLSLAQITSTSTHAWYVRDVLADIFSAYGITANVDAVSPNWKIAKMPRVNGQPISWVQDLLDVTQAAWYEDDDQIICVQPDWLGAGTPDHTFDTAETILRGFSGSESAVEIVNYLTAQKSDDNGGVVANANGDTYGPYTASFSPPVPLASLSWYEKLNGGGIISDIYVYGPLGPPALPIAVFNPRSTPPPVIGGTMAHSVAFTWGNYVGGGGTGAPFALEFRADTSDGVYSGKPSVTAKDDASIASGLGELRDSLGPNSLIADEETLQFWADATLARRAKRQWRGSGIVLFRHGHSILPGQVVRVLDRQRDWTGGPTAVRTVTRNLLIEQVSHTLVPEPIGRLTTFQGVAYVS